MKFNQSREGCELVVGDDLHDVAILNLAAKRNHAAIDAGAGAGVTHFRVNHVSKVDGRRAAWQLNDLTHWRKRINVLRIEIELQRVEKILRVFYFLGPLNERSQRLQRLIVVTRSSFAFLVFPVSRNTFLGDVMHLLGANLNFKRLNVGTDNGSVQRLVEIVARSGNPVFDATWNRFPVVMDHAQSRIAMTHFIGSDDPRRNEIVNLIQSDLLLRSFFQIEYSRLTRPSTRTNGTSASFIFCSIRAVTLFRKASFSGRRFSSCSASSR